jgi:hypothetical protein
MLHFPRNLLVLLPKATEQFSGEAFCIAFMRLMNTRAITVPIPP